MIRCTDPVECQRLADAADAEGLPLTAAKYREHATDLIMGGELDALAFRHGRDAGYQQWRGISDNPHRMGTTQYAAWQRGFREGREWMMRRY